MSNENKPGSFGSSRGILQKPKKDKTRKSSSTRWIGRQLNDPYVLETQKRGYKSRAAFKLLQINEKHNFLLPGLSVIDLGCAPGGWLQIAAQKVCSMSGKEKVVGVDLLSTDDIAGCVSILGDISNREVGKELINILGCRPNIVMSDMAANTTGHRQTDHIRTTYLLETALDFAIENLQENGVFLAKCFKGGAEIEALSLMRKHFSKVSHIKPDASRKESVEGYVIATGFKCS
jgi:23S rRNA (uridine2552-2'-O)-methyltransferase|tara:strand:+ start:1425 stop:2123 length:699 start_codon:yes stop_codon:yes gene_type:complete